MTEIDPTTITLEEDLRTQIKSIVREIWDTDDISKIDQTMRKLSVLRFSVSKLLGDAEASYSEKFVEFVNQIDDKGKKTGAGEAERRADHATANAREKLGGLLDSLDEAIRACKVSIRVKTGDWAAAGDIDNGGEKKGGAL